MVKQHDLYSVRQETLSSENTFMVFRPVGLFLRLRSVSRTLLGHLQLFTMF